MGDLFPSFSLHEGEWKGRFSRREREISCLARATDLINDSIFFFTADQRAVERIEGG